MVVDDSYKPTIIDPTTGEVTAVELFVAVLGASEHGVLGVSRAIHGRDTSHASG